MHCIIRAARIFRGGLSLATRVALAVWRNVDGQRPPPPAAAGQEPR